MMSLKESPRNHPWVLPKKMPVWCEFPILCSSGWVITSTIITAGQGRDTTIWEKNL